MTGPYQQQVTSLQAASTMYTNQQKAWTTLQSDASATASSLSTLSQASTFQQLAATSSNTNVATASDNSAQAGSYNLTVTQLAQAEIDQGSSANMQVSSPSSALGLSGSFTVAVGSGSAKTINVSSTDTLNTIAQNINNSGAGVKATVEQQSSGNWILAIQGNTTGSGQGITFTDTAGSGSTYGPLYSLGLYNDPSNAKFSGEVVQKAQDASLYFGSNSSSPITSSTNTFNNAIPGVTLVTSGVGSTTVTVSANVSAMTQAVQTFVNNYNTWVKDTENLAMGTVAGNASSTTSSQGQTTSSYQTNPNQVLTSPLPMQVLNQIQTVLGGWTGNSSNIYQSLADIGITYNSNNTGTLTINKTQLQSALTNHPNSVGTLFTDLQKMASPMFQAFDSGTTSTTGEALSSLQTQLSQTKLSLSMAKSQLTTAEQQAISQYGQWVKAVSSYANTYSTVQAMFNQSGTNQGG